MQENLITGEDSGDPEIQAKACGKMTG